MESLGPQAKTNFYQITNLPNAWWYPPSTYNFIPLIAAGPSSFSVARPDESVRTGKKEPCRGGTTRP